jgi:transcriptional regulator of NAD metabolism
MTDRFAVSVREIATIEGLPEYPFVVIDHPIAGNLTDELHAKAERALAEVVSLLTERKG